ncbi:MFS transporter [Paenibacillus polymyxa]|uniref:MFS transporter n=1 Tax=Paenibacillus polymyxa TaxID=1406 RepID=UPI0025B6FB27|nr:MFS transporter [Paenibacillus polymyxa]MDN4079321.1 MFS transporter [Paenibacillus polymyxa]MDN4104741.1 MFS transporter [Paenibacillus polymyxa]MDN4115222.1 MFS transporter [Paenibacillus polymyxa]
MANRYKLFFFALILASFNLRPGITSVSPLLHGITDDLGMSSTTASLLTSIPLLCMGIGSLFAGRLASHFQSEKIITIFIACIGIATFLRFFAISPLYLLITALFIGVGIGIVSPLMSGFIKNYFADKVALMIGMYSTFMVVGASIAVGLTTPIQHWFSDSWKAGLGFWFVFALITIPLWIGVMNHPHTLKQRTSTQQRSSLPLQNKQAWLLTAFAGLATLLFYCISAWLPAIVEDKGYDSSYAGLVGTLCMIAQLPVTLCLHLLLRAIPSRKFWITFFIGSEIVGLILLGFTDVTPIMASICLGISAGGLISLTLLLPIDKTNSALEASTWSAMTQAIGYMIGAIGPIIIGVLYDYTGSFRPTMYLLIVLGLVVIFLGWKIAKPVTRTTINVKIVSSPK